MDEDEKSLKKVLSLNPKSFDKYRKLSPTNNRRSINVFSHHSGSPAMQQLKLKVELLETQVNILTSDMEKLIEKLEPDEDIIDKTNDKIIEMEYLKEKLIDIRELLDIELNVVIGKAKNIDSNLGIKTGESNEHNLLRIMYNDLKEKTEALTRRDAQSNERILELEIKVTKLASNINFPEIKPEKKKKCIIF